MVDTKEIFWLAGKPPILSQLHHQLRHWRYGCSRDPAPLYRDYQAELAQLMQAQQSSSVLFLGLLESSGKLRLEQRLFQQLNLVLRKPKEKRQGD